MLEELKQITKTMAQMFVIGIIVTAGIFWWFDHGMEVIKNGFVLSVFIVLGIFLCMKALIAFAQMEIIKSIPKQDSNTKR